MAVYCGDVGCAVDIYEYRHLWKDETATDFAIYELTDDRCISASLVDYVYSEKHEENGLIYLGYHKCKYFDDVGIGCRMFHRAHSGIAH